MPIHLYSGANSSQQIAPQGDTRGLHPTGLHTLTMQEIIANANRRDPTQPYYVEGGNVGRWVDPMEPHWTYGDNSRLIDPRKLSPKISGPA